MTRKIIRITSLVIILAGFTYAAVSLAQNSTAAKVGDPAPEFTLENMEGNMVSLSDYRGEFVVLNFFTTWCPPCREEAPDLQAFEEEYGDQVKLLILDRAEPKVNVQEHIEEFDSTSTYLLDYNDSMSKPYGVKGQPETFFIDEDGIIRKHHVGPMTKEFIVETVNMYRKTDLKSSTGGSE